MLKSDRQAAAWATGAAVALIAQQIASKACRDALFLSHFGAEQLPFMMGGAALLSIVCVLALARAFSRRGPAYVVPRALSLSGAIFLVEWLLLTHHPGLAAVCIYLHVATFGAVAISGFWSVVTERFDPHTAKASISRISSGAVFGGILGGILADRVTATLGLELLLPMMAILSWLGGSLIRAMGAPVRRSFENVAQAHGSNPSMLTREPYLRNLGLMAILVAASTTLLDYAFKAEAAEAFTERSALVSFFALFYTLSGVITFGVQTAFCRRILQHLGIGASLALLPLTVLAGGLLGTAWTRLWTVTLVRGAESVLTHSIYRSAYEPLFAPVSQNMKRPTKALIDVGCSRLGDAIGSAAVLAILFFSPEHGNSISILAATVASTVALIFIRRLNLGYIRLLIRQLRTGSLRLYRPRLSGQGHVTTQASPQHTPTLARLGLWVEPETARLVLRAAKSGDQALRGCALELLDQTVPAALRAEVAALSAPGSLIADKPTVRAVDELLSSMMSLRPSGNATEAPSAHVSL